MTHRKIADLGHFEIWAAPSGLFEVYSPTARVAIKRSEQAALEFATACQAREDRISAMMLNNGYTRHAAEYELSFKA